MFLTFVDDDEVYSDFDDESEDEELHVEAQENGIIHSFFQPMYLLFWTHAVYEMIFCHDVQFCLV